MVKRTPSCPHRAYSLVGKRDDKQVNNVCICNIRAGSVGNTNRLRGGRRLKGALFWAGRSAKASEEVIIRPGPE